jgi:hypothetical protein
MKIDLKLLNEMVRKELDEIEILEQQNTLAADINEIYTGYYCLGGSWNGFMNAGEAQTAIEQRKAQLPEDVVKDQIGRAEVMAKKSLEWAHANKYDGSVKEVWWTARPNVLSKAVGHVVDSRKNPTDILLKFSDGGFLGLSAKSTKGSGDIGFKNPGIGSLSKAIGVDLYSYVEKVEQEAIQKYKLPLSKKERKDYIRSNPQVAEKTQKIGISVLNKLRDTLFDYYKANFNEEQFKKHILNIWLDADAATPYYIKVTGNGRNGNYSAHVYDPMNNDKLKALSSEKVSISPIGNESIMVSAGGLKLFRIRFKYESEKLASAIKLSGDPA